MKIGKIVCMLAVLLLSFAARAEEKGEIAVPEEYVTFIRKLKKEMITRGISKKTVEKVYEKNYYRPEPEVVKKDRRQVEFLLTATEYLNRVVNKQRAMKAREKYRELYPLFRDMEGKYGVGFHYLVAFWGVETNFGERFGGYEVIDALTTLAYDKRRPKFFREELYQALKIIDKYDIDYTKMEGSWAGAMGHFQFMPSTFNAYAIDYDGDGMIDIWHSFEDAVSSAANYLSKMGWSAGQEWGCEASLDWNFNYAHAGLNNNKTVEEWSKLGVKTKGGKALPFDKTLSAAVIMPEGKKGRAYLVLNNFKKIMNWNRSENYALAISTLADYIKNGGQWKAFGQTSAVRVRKDDIMKIQNFINNLFKTNLAEDGQLGSKTREAIKVLQKEAKMPQDGYPDYQLLQKINRYNPKVGFAVPVPVRKTQ